MDEREKLMQAVEKCLKEDRVASISIFDMLESRCFYPRKIVCERHCLSLDVMEEILSEIKCEAKKDNPVLGEKFAYIIQGRVERIEHISKNAVIVKFLYNDDEVAEVKIITEERIPDDLYAGMQKCI